MGVTIQSNHGSQCFDAGYGGFFNLRKNIALAYDTEFGELYSQLLHMPSDEFNNKMNKLLEDARFLEEDVDLLDFFFASDCDGEISYRTCKKIYELIKDIDFGNKIFTYAAYSDGKDYEHFKTFLLECYSHRRKMRWS